MRHWSPIGIAANGSPTRSANSFPRPCTS